MDDTLQGVTVIALEQAVAGPTATRRLAEAGARVIKLERPEGDFSRAYDDFVLGQATYHVSNDRGKQSCRVDLKTEEDRALVERMLSRADVFVRNLAPGAADRLGFSAAALREKYPRLIICDISGYGAGTPDHERKAYDLLIQAETGLAGVTGSPTSGPSRVGVSICDIATGNAAYAAILEALLRRARAGAGCHIELSLFDVTAELMNVPYLTSRYGRVQPTRLGLAHPSIAPYGVFSLADGDLLIAVQNDREWRTLCADVLGDAELAADSRFAQNKDRIRDRAEVDGRVQQHLKQRKVGELSVTLDRFRIAYGRISMLEDLQNHRSATLMPVKTPAGEVELLAPGVTIDGRRAPLGDVPALGEHDTSLRREFAPEAAPTKAG